MQTSQEIVKKAVQRAQEKQKVYYDRKAKAVRLEVGDSFGKGFSFFWST